MRAGALGTACKLFARVAEEASRRCGPAPMIREGGSGGEDIAQKGKATVRTDDAVRRLAVRPNREQMHWTDCAALDDGCGLQARKAPIAQRPARLDRPGCSSRKLLD